MEGTQWASVQLIYIPTYIDILTQDVYIKQARQSQNNTLVSTYQRQTP